MLEYELYFRMILKGIKTAAAYIYDDDKVSYSIQMKEIKRFAEMYDLDIKTWFYDSNPKREAYCDMIHDSPPEDCDCIIAYRLDRMFDSVDDYNRCMEILQGNTELFFCLDFDETKISGELMFRRFYLS